MKKSHHEMCFNSDEISFNSAEKKNGEKAETKEEPKEEETVEKEFKIPETGAEDETKGKKPKTKDEPETQEDAEPLQLDGENTEGN